MNIASVFVWIMVYFGAGVMVFYFVTSISLKLKDLDIESITLEVRSI